MDRRDRERGRTGFKSHVLPGVGQTDLVSPTSLVKNRQTSLDFVSLTQGLKEVLGLYLFNTKTRAIIISALTIFTGELDNKPMPFHGAALSHR